MKTYLVIAMFLSVVIASYAVLAVFGLQIMALRHRVEAGRIVLMTFLAGVMIATSLVIFLMIQESLPVFFARQSFIKEPTCLASLSALPRPSAPCARGKTIL